MDPAIVGGIIGGAGAVIGAVIAAIIAVSSRKRLDNIEKETLDTSLAVRKDLMDTFGYTMGSVVWKLRMTDVQGAVELTRICRDVKVVRSGVVITQIPGRVWVVHPAGRITTCPTLIGTPSLPAKAVELKILQENDKECVFNIEVTGGLTDGDPGLDYEFQTICSKGMCVTREEMEDAYRQADFKKEYHSFDVTTPIDILELEAEFPEGYRVQAYPIVFYLNSELTINRELERVRGGFNISGTSAKFKIEQPKIGFRYAIYWVPPSLREVEQLAR